jgi:hypothetical protein
VASIHAAELQLLAASQRAERSQAIRAIDAALSSRHASNIAAVIARFADRRVALMEITDPTARTAAACKLAAEETAELARLALEHAAEKRTLRKATTAPLVAVHRAQRRFLKQSLRRQRVGIAVQLQALRPRSTTSRTHPKATSSLVRHLQWRAPTSH